MAVRATDLVSSVVSLAYAGEGSLSQRLLCSCCSGLRSWLEIFPVSRYSSRRSVQEDITRGREKVDSVYQGQQGTGGTHNAVLSSSEYLSNSAKNLNNIEDGYYIAPAFLDKLSIHVAKNFLDLPKIKVPLILGQSLPPGFSALSMSRIWTTIYCVHLCSWISHGVTVVDYFLGQRRTQLCSLPSVCSGHSVPSTLFLL